MDLPEDVIVYLTEFININDYLEVIKTNKYMYKLFVNNSRIFSKICDYKDIYKYNHLKVNIHITNLHLAKDKDIMKFTNLKSLYIRDNNITDKCIKKLINLVNLTLSSKSVITDDGIKNLIKLERLFINSNKNITNDGIKNLINLKYLYVKNTNITIDAIKNMKLKILECCWKVI